MRYACDACRLRKVKCKGLQSNGTVEVTAPCEFCESIGIPCRITPRQRQRAKTGRKRADPSAVAASSTQSLKRRRAEHPSTALACTPSAFIDKDVGSARTTRDGSSRCRARLFGVPGLTREALDVCIDAFFQTVGVVLRLFDSQQVFSRRVRLQLYYSSGLDIPADLGDAAGNPASRLLILAVACRGSHFSPYSELAGELYAQCCHLLSKAETLATGTLDAIEAILLLSELTIQPRHLSPTKLDPLGKGTAVDIALHYGLNIPPPAGSPEYERRRGVFMRVWAYDAIRSASAQTSHRITEDDMGWPMPPNPNDYPYLCLTLITRRVGETLLSPRVIGLGPSEADVRSCLQSVHDFRSQTKVNLGTLFSAVSGASSGDAAPRNGLAPLHPLEQLFLLSSHNWLYLVMWVAVQDSADRHPGSLPDPLTSEIEQAAMSACEDTATLARLSTAHNLYASGPKSIRNHMAAFSLFLVRAFTATPTPPVDVLLQFFALAESLNAGVRAASFYPDSMVLAETLRVALYRASRVELKDAARVAERGLDALPPDESAIRTFEAINANLEATDMEAELGLTAGPDTLAYDTCEPPGTSGLDNAGSSSNLGFTGAPSSSRPQTPPRMSSACGGGLPRARSKNQAVHP